MKKSIIKKNNPPTKAEENEQLEESENFLC